MSGMSPDFLALIQRALGGAPTAAGPTTAGVIPGLQPPQTNGSPYFDADGRLISGPDSAAKPSATTSMMDLLMKPRGEPTAGGMGGAASINPFHHQGGGIGDDLLKKGGSSLMAAMK